MFWIGLFLVLFVLGGRELIHGGIKAVVSRITRFGQRAPT
jgi:branched-chain amino acid transport system permease protein